MLEIKIIKYSTNNQFFTIIDSELKLGDYCFGHYDHFYNKHEVYAMNKNDKNLIVWEK